MPKADEVPFLAPEEQDVEAAQKPGRPRTASSYLGNACRYWHWVVIAGLLLCLGVVSTRSPRDWNGPGASVVATEIPGILPILRTTRESIRPYFEPDHVFPNGSYSPLYSDYVGPPSDRMDSFWEDLDGPNLMSLEAAELGDFAAQAMKNPLAESGYVTSLQVFHQLHCLRAIQKAVYKEQYGKPHNMLHIDHCIDLIRRTITCASDATPILYYLPEGSTFTTTDDSGNLRSMPHVHTCRNFDDIVQWAKQRVLV